MSFADELRGNGNDSGKSPSVSRLHEETINKIRKAQADFIKEFEKAVRQITIIKNNCNNIQYGMMPCSESLCRFERKSALVFFDFART